MNDLLSLQKMFNETIFRIPDYQRGYSWSNKQLNEFWSDLICLLPYQEHYTGMISLKKLQNADIAKLSNELNEEKWLIDAGYSIYEVVDGQQRLTTLIILINEIVQYCEEHFISELNSTVINEIKEKYLFKSKPNNIIRTYKFGYEEDNPSYKYFRHAILGEPSSGTINETFYTLNLMNAKKFFKEKLKDLADTYGISKIEEIYRKITLQLKFNIYYIVDDFNVFVAFETMNNRGKTLSYLERLKNRLIYLSTLFDNDEDEKKQVRKEINDTWKDIYGYLGKNKSCPLNDDEFLLNHWMIYFGYQTRKINGNQTIAYHTYLLDRYFIQQNIDPNNIYVPDLSDFVTDKLNENDDFDDNFIKKQECIENDIKITNEKKIKLTLEDIQNYVNSLKDLIQYWYCMYFPSNNYSDELKKALYRIKELGFVNAKPLITVILLKNNITEKEKVNCIKQIERFNFLHYRLNGYSPVYNNSVFFNLARDLYYDEITITDVFNIVLKIDYMSDNNVIRSAGVIEKFRKLFNRDGFYSWGTLRFLLYAYDISNTKTLAEQKLNINDYFKQDEKDMCSIEHIYPQKAIDEYWINRFNEFSDKERKIMTGSLGNLLPLSKKINSKLQNYSFDIKKERYKDGSRSEHIVSQNEEWTPNKILERGLEIVDFMQKEWNFFFPSKADKIRFLGLDFLLTEDDEKTDINEYIEYSEEKIKDYSDLNEPIYLSINDTLYATAYYRNNGLIVKKNSKIRNDINPTKEYISSMINQEIVKGNIVDGVFVKDTYFETPSRAATIIAGMTRNGWTSWKNEKKITLEDLLKPNAEKIEKKLREKLGEDYEIYFCSRWKFIQIWKKSWDNINYAGLHFELLWKNKTLTEKNVEISFLFHNERNTSKKYVQLKNKLFKKEKYNMDNSVDADLAILSIVENICNIINEKSEEIDKIVSEGENDSK